MRKNKPIKLRPIKRLCKTLDETIANVEIALDYLTYGQTLPRKEPDGKRYFISLDRDEVRIGYWQGESSWGPDYEKLKEYFEPLGYEVSYKKGRKRLDLITTFIKPGPNQR